MLQKFHLYVHGFPLYAVKFQRQKKMSENKEILVNWERRGESLDGNITVKTMKVMRKSSA